MKKILYSFYGLIIDKLTKNNDNYYFYYNDILYIFYLVENNIDLITKINENYKICEFYEVIKNNKSSIITKIDNKKYALIKTKGILKYKISINEFINLNVNEEPINWGRVWSERLNYYNIQIRELGKKYQTLINSYGFFEGLTENAILYYNIIIKNFINEKTVSIVHNRMYYPCYEVDYFNPVNLIFDYSVRDIAEYIKSYIISEDYELNSVITLLNNLKLNDTMFNLLYCRLLYPTFYFDLFDKIILNNHEISELNKILKKTKNYINLLKEIYLCFNKKIKLLNINWINKNVEF